MAGHAKSFPMGEPLQLPRLDEIVVTIFACFGVIGGVYIAVCHKEAPSIVAAILLSTGLSAFIYRFLGGIGDASFAVGALKLSGSAAVLFGLAFAVDNKLTHETVHVQYLKGTLVEKSDGGGTRGIEGLRNEDFVVFPSAGQAAKLGDFSVAFIRDDNAAPGADKAYVTVRHKGFEDLTLPLEIDALKEKYPGASEVGDTMSVKNIILARAGTSAPYSDAKDPTFQPLQPEQEAAYRKTSKSAKRVN
jgi:hypothetical protein